MNTSEYLSLEAAALTMGTHEDVDIDQHLEVWTQPPGWHEHASLDVDDMSVDALIDEIDKLYNS